MNWKGGQMKLMMIVGMRRIGGVGEERGEKGWKV